MADSKNSDGSSNAVIVQIDVHHRPCSQLNASIATTNNVRVNSRQQRHGAGRVKKYDAFRRQIYHPISKRNRRTTAQQVARQFLAASGKQISRKTVARRLRGERTIRTQTCCVCPIDA
ncbi:hypothetical protein TNCV_3731641 [Trichonephila clavipes]|nr:hypothetical protein TNCV_3731641 [Trichonephila clavipes]